MLVLTSNKVFLEFHPAKWGCYFPRRGSQLKYLESKAGFYLLWLRDDFFSRDWNRFFWVENSFLMQNAQFY